MTALADRLITGNTVHRTLPNGFAYANPLQREQYDANFSVNGASKVCLVRSGDEAKINLAIEELALAHPRADRHHIGTFALELTADLAVRLRPPRTIDDVLSTLGKHAAVVATLTGPQARAWYVSQYNAGWQAGRRGGYSPAWDSGMTSGAWDDGYLDGAAGRTKWHLTYCTDHDNCGEG